MTRHPAAREDTTTVTDADLSTETPTTDPADDRATDHAHDTDEHAERTEDKGSGEAAKWRRRLRDTERERDDLAARLDTVQRRELARVATTPGRDEHGRPTPCLFDTADVFADGADLADLLDDDGHLDEGRVRATIVAATDGRGHVRADLAPRPPRAAPSQGTSATEVGRRNAGEGWQSLLRGGR